MFAGIERHIEAPFGIIFQLEHSELAGQLAAVLTENVFGDIPADVIQAIAQHDFGWTASDDDQMKSLAEKPPQPFPALSTQETLPSWYRSTAHAQSLGQLAYVMVSRHFTTLGMGDASRAEFVREETAQRTRVEEAIGIAAADLDRWTDAVGFSDLVSLYLCCGAEETVDFPLAHPAGPNAPSAQKVTLSWASGSPRFSPPVLKPGTTLRLKARTYSGQGSEVTPLHLEWRFPHG